MIGKYLKLKLNFGVIYFLMSQLTLGDILSNLNIGIASHNQLEDDLDSIEEIESSLSSLSISESSESTDSRIDKYMSMLDEFYNNLDDNTIYKIIDIINRRSKISLRLIEWVVSKYSQNHVIEIYSNDGSPMNIYNSYHIKTKVYEKKYFDLFRRVNVITYKFKNNDNMKIETTISQLNFFKWLLENNIFWYIEENRDKLSKLMSSDNAIERDNRKRKILMNGKVRRKKCI